MSRKARISIVFVMILLLSACSDRVTTEAQQGTGFTDPDEQKEVQLETTLHSDSKVPDQRLQKEPLQEETQMNYQEQAEKWISNAFLFDVSGIEPAEESYGDLTTIRYNLKEDDFFVVEYRDGFSYPAMIYHFCHLGADPGFDLANEYSDYFKEDMVTTARNFVTKVFGVDCTQAGVHAYGYGNKIAVQLAVSSNEIFQVRFYYSEDEPVGVLFFNDVEAFDKAMETNKAKKYY